MIIKRVSLDTVLAPEKYLVVTAGSANWLLLFVDAVSIDNDSKLKVRINGNIEN